MAIASDGIGGYAIGPDGQRIYPHKSSFTVNGVNLFQYDQATGVLQLSISPSELERMLETLGPFPSEGRNMAFSFHPLGEQVFPSLKRIESVAGPDGTYLLDPSRTSSVPPLPSPQLPTRGGFSSLIDSIRSYLPSRKKQ